MKTGYKPDFHFLRHIVYLVVQCIFSYSYHILSFHPSGRNDSVLIKLVNFFTFFIANVVTLSSQKKRSKVSQHSTQQSTRLFFSCFCSTCIYFDIEIILNSQSILEEAENAHFERTKKVFSLSVVDTTINVHFLRALMSELLHSLWKTTKEQSMG